VKGKGTVGLQLRWLAHARSGDKGDTANVGVIALRPEWYPVLEQFLKNNGIIADMVINHKAPPAPPAAVPAAAPAGAPPAPAAAPAPAAPAAAPKK